MELTTTQLAAIIGKSERTVQRWIAAGILKASAISHNRYEISEADLAALTQHDARATDIVELRAIIAEQDLRIAALEQSISEILARWEQTPEIALQRENEPSIDKPSDKPSSHVRPPKIAVQLQKSTLPAGYIGFREMARRHGIAETTVQKAVVSGRLQFESGTWPVGRAIVRQAFNLEQQAAFVTLYRGRDGWHLCDDATCVCQGHEQAGDI